jgi:UDP:flavonoid glycosyltransferase YjiC (YdhE family)
MPAPARAQDQGGGQARKRILFFAEAVTLAHIARISVLAASLDPLRYEAVIACRSSLHPLLPAGIRCLPLNSIPSEQFVAALARGGRVYSLATLRRYAQEDRELISAETPDLIVGDFRLSLSVSARLAQRPYVAICNAYWSPYARYSRMPLPELPMTQLLPLPLAEAAFRASLFASMAWHERPLNQLRGECALGRLPKGLRHVLHRCRPRAVHRRAGNAPHRWHADDPPLHRPHFVGAAGASAALVR